MVRAQQAVRRRGAAVVVRQLCLEIWWRADVHLKAAVVEEGSALRHEMECWWLVWLVWPVSQQHLRGMCVERWRRRS
jgi:hypothetical protein